MSRESQHTHFEDKIHEQVRPWGFPPSCASLARSLVLSRIGADVLRNRNFSRSCFLNFQIYPQFVNFQIYPQFVTAPSVQFILWPHFYPPSSFQSLILCPITLTRDQPRLRGPFKNVIFKVPLYWHCKHLPFVLWLKSLFQKFDS